MTQKLIEELVNIGREKLSLLNTMLELTEEQNKLIKKEDMEKVDLNINKKDSLIKKIESLDIQFLSKFTQLKKDNNIKDINELDIKDYPELKNLKEVVQEISSTLMAISLLDKENNVKMRKNLESIKSNLKNIKKGQKVYKSYNKTLNNSILIDEKK